MDRFSPKALWQSLCRLARFAARQRIGLYAANASFFIVLSLFPSLVLLLGLLRHTGLEVSRLVSAVGAFVPQALLPLVKSLILSAYSGTTGTVLSLSALTALWSAGRGVQGLLCGLYAIYGITEGRSWLGKRIAGIVYTAAFLLILLLTLALGVFGRQLLQALPQTQLLTQLLPLRFLLLPALQSLVLCALYRVPSGSKVTFRQTLPGAVVACLGWLVFSRLYSVYALYSVRYTTIYGSVYAVALFMLWLYCCIGIVFFGGVLNRCLLNHKRCN